MSITKVSPDLLDLDAGITISVSDNSDNLTLTSTDDDANSGPNLRLYRNSSSPADDDVVGVIDFEGRNNNSQDVIYANIQGEIMQEADGSEDGQLQFGVMKAGTLRNAFMIDRTEVAINEDSVDIDFRVESNTSQAMLFVDGGNDRVGINTTSPDSLLDIEGVHSQLILTDSDDSKFVLFSYSGGKLLVRNNDTSTTSKQFTLTEDGDFGIGTHVPDSVLHIKDPTSDTVLTMEGGASDANCRINFQNSGGTFRGMLSYDTDDNNLQFNVNDAERMRITSAGVLSIGDASPESGDASAPTSLYLQGGEANMIIKNTDATSSSQRQGIAFLNSSGTRVGTITITSSATGYATSSDYRLKENVDYTWDATTRLKQLKPARFNWIADDTNTLVDGFLAHEVSNVVPEAVIGEKDETQTKTKLVYDSNDILLAENIEESDWTDGKSDGTYPNDSTWVASKDFNIHQGIDQSKLIPLLVKTIQELEARITTLEG